MSCIRACVCRGSGGTCSGTRVQFLGMWTLLVVKCTFISQRLGRKPESHPNKDCSLDSPRPSASRGRTRYHSQELPGQAGMAGIPPAALAEGIKGPGQERHTQEPAVTPTLAQAQVISRVPFRLPGSRLTGAKPGLPSLTPGTQTQPQGCHKLCHELIPGHVAWIQTQTRSRAPR